MSGELPTEVRLPQLADSVTEVIVGAWLKREGDRVEAGESIVEVETDKTTVELEAPVAGVLSAIQVAEGTEGIETGALLALIRPHAETSGPTLAAVSTAPTAPLEKTAASTTLSQAEEETVDAASTEGAAVAVTPMARRMASAAGIDLSKVAGTGRDGRIMKADIDRLLPGALGAETSLASAAASEGGGFRDEPLTAMRRVTATRMEQAKQTVPHFYLRAECDVDAAMVVIAQAKTLGRDQAPTLTDLVIRAAALALRHVPRANSAWAGGALRLYDAVDIALAVNTADGLITPIIRAADTKDLGDIARDSRALVARAREGSLRPDDYTGGTFTISNLGMYGVDSLFAIVNPPQSCVLGVGSATRRPIAVGNDVRIGTMMSCTLSADHRAIDGATGAELLAAVKRYLEQPALMVL
ncbi:MAG: hypothetical protein CL483_11185 [Acidobacteria bacterium]|nr:hypothetical protein [Acidobacteriota bacterium]